jgi:hypothetical protein
MFEKKLMTLFGFAGILACGACLLPPLPQRKIPLPPPLSAIHKIDLQVEDKTGSRFFDPSQMSPAVADQFNHLWSGLPIKAQSFKSGDAILMITVLQKTISCKADTSRGGTCFYTLTASLTLTSADGRVLRSCSSQHVEFSAWSRHGAQSDTLNEDPARQQAAYSLAIAAGNFIAAA